MQLHLDLAPRYGLLGIGVRVLSALFCILDSQFGVFWMVAIVFSLVIFVFWRVSVLDSCYCILDGQYMYASYLVQCAFKLRVNCVFSAPAAV